MMAAETVVSRLAPTDEPDYTAFLTARPEALLYYGLPYRDFLADLLQCSPVYWIARRQGQITGVLPMMERDGPWGRVINSLPFFGSHGGVLAADDQSSQALYDRYAESVAAPGVVAATWIDHPHPAPEAAAPPHTLVDERIGQMTPLTPDEGAMLALIDSSARRNIKRALAAGVTVEIDNSQIAFLEEVHRSNMLDIGGNPKTPAFFQAFPRHFKAGAEFRIYVARQAGEAVAALLLFYFGRTVEYFTPVTLAVARSDQPMAAILHQAMLDAAREGYAQWNWGGTWLTQEGVWRFKKKWGAQEKPYRYYIKLNDRSLLKRTPAELSAAYPGFYVVPFDQLERA
jgi:hypothetical protein